MWLVVHEGKAQPNEAVDGSIYRGEMRKGWTPHPVDDDGAPLPVGSNGPHPFAQAMHRAATLVLAQNFEESRNTRVFPAAAVPSQTW
jgi:hypothetical protein